MSKETSQKNQRYGTIENHLSRPKHEIKVIERFLNEEAQSTALEWVGAIKLLFILIFKIINPLNWKTVYRLSYYTWLKANKKYEKLLEIWSAKRPKNTAGQVVKSLKMVDCYIQLGKYTEGMNCLKTLTTKIESADRDNEWKEEKHHQVKFYRNTIHNLATLSYRKTIPK